MLFIRHGQSEFNVVFGQTGEDPGIEDPGLTELGRRQAIETAKALEQAEISRLIASPYKRALQTAEIISGHLGLSISIDPIVREHKHFTCDIGTPRSKLTVDWPGLDFDHLDEQWWPDTYETESEVAVRCETFMSRLPDIDDWQEVGVVSHWGFIRGLTGLSMENCGVVQIAPGRPARLVHSPKT